jgi:peptidoglycan glycosyltransferase
MVEVASIIANKGVLVRPHLTLEESNEGESLGGLEQAPATRILSEELAETVRGFMVSVVENGQANGVGNLGVAVGGKTGTAEAGDGTSHAWFIAFAPAESPTVAVAVIVENGGQGGVVASPIAGQVLRAALAR